MITKQTIYFWNIFFSRRSIWVLLELVRRWTQHFTKIDQEKRINWTKLHLKPHDYRILLCKHWFTSLVWNFCLWVADVRFLLAKRLQRRGARGVCCFRWLLVRLLYFLNCISKATMKIDFSSVLTLHYLQNGPKPDTLLPPHRGS